MNAPLTKPRSRFRLGGLIFAELDDCPRDHDGRRVFAALLDDQVEAGDQLLPQPPRNCLILE
jgi:hypothetical protein